MLLSAGDQAGAERAWRRAFLVNTNQPQHLLSRMRPHVAEHQLLEWLPPSAEWWLLFASTTPDQNSRDDAALKVITNGTRGGQALSTDWAEWVGRAYLQLGDGPAAKEYLTQAVQAQPNNVDRRMSLASALELMGEYLAARQELETAQQLAPQRGDIRQRLERLR
jgi:Tfp pilus assembly protein PilF